MSLETNTTPTIEESAQDALTHLTNILEAGEFNASAKLAGIEGEVVSLDIDGEDANLLIGRRGQVLDSLQYLLLVMVTHDRVATSRLRVHLDADGYRRRRAEALRELARDLANQVRETGEEAVLEPLNPLERRIVHTELVDDADVETYSEGDEPNRHIVITPRRSKS